MKYSEDFLNKFICGNSVDIMKQIPDCSIDLVVTSPPYNLRNRAGNIIKNRINGKWANAAIKDGYSNYKDNMPHAEYVTWQRDCLTEMLRVITEKGAIFYNHKWRIQKGLLQDRKDIVSGFPVRQIIIWARKAGFNFRNSFFLPTYEVIYLIAKPKFRLVKKANAHGDLWNITQENNNRHPAPFPVDLVERIISSTDARIILDPFMGSGTTALVARNLNRNFIGIDNSLEYCEMAQERLDEPASIRNNANTQYKPQTLHNYKKK